MATITRTEQSDTIAYSLVIDGHEVSELVIDAATRKVVNVETATAHRGQGHARTLWAHANTEAECFHAIEHHRTPEGDAFALAVGGDTIPAELDIIDTCCICSGDYDEEI